MARGSSFRGSSQKRRGVPHPTAEEARFSVLDHSLLADPALFLVVFTNGYDLLHPHWLGFAHTYRRLRGYEEAVRLGIGGGFPHTGNRNTIAMGKRCRHLRRGRHLRYSHCRLRPLHIFMIVSVGQLR